MYSLIGVLSVCCDFFVVVIITGVLTIVLTSGIYLDRCRSRKSSFYLLFKKKTILLFVFFLGVGVGSGGGYSGPTFVIYVANYTGVPSTPVPLRSATDRQ